MASVNPTGRHGPKKRHHGQGTIVERRDHWRAEPWLWTLRGTDHRGKRVLVASCSGSSKTQVGERARAILRELAAGTNPDALSMTVADQLWRWLATVRDSDVKPRTWERYRGTVRGLAPAFEDVPLAHLDADLVRARLIGTPSARAFRLLVLRMAMRAAVPRLLRSDPTAGVRLPHGPVREAPTIDAATGKRILEACAERTWGPFVVLAMTTGLRRGELLALRWTDWDRRAGELDVRWNLQRVPVEYRTAAEPHALRPERPKSARSIRRVPLPAIAADALAAAEEAQRTARIAAPVWAENGLVFANERGEPWHPNTATREAEALLRLVVPGMRLHDARAAWETLLASGGVSDHIRMRLAGHATTAQTLDYTKVVPADARRAVRALDEALG